MKTKHCKYCNTNKPIIDFYAHPKCKDGLNPKCKACSIESELKRQNRLKNNEAYKKSERERSLKRYHDVVKHRVKNKEAKEKIRKTYYEKFPEKRLAQKISSLLPKKKGHNLHHWSYNSEHLTSLIELPIKDHHKLHRYIIYDQERMMYRRSDNNELLDTKEKHEAYYSEIKHND